MQAYPLKFVSIIRSLDIIQKGWDHQTTALSKHE